jgi:hypothetical protein
MKHRMRVSAANLSYGLSAFFRFLPLAFCHSFSRLSISEFGTATTARNTLSILWKGVFPVVTLGKFNHSGIIRLAEVPEVTG